MIGLNQQDLTLESRYITHTTSVNESIVPTNRKSDRIIIGHSEVLSDAHAVEMGIEQKIADKKSTIP